MSDATDSAYPPGTICHVELPSTDFAATIRFYTEVFGWTFNTQWMPEYPMFTAGNGTGGGLMPAEGPTDGTTLVLAVADIAAILPRITAAGGQVLSQIIEIPQGMGSYAYFRDPGGSKMGVWMPAK